MDTLSDWLGLAVAILALVLSVWGLMVSRRTAQREETNDFYRRRQDILYNIIDARIRHAEVESLVLELQGYQRRLGSDADVPTEGNRNAAAIDKLESMVRQLPPTGPIHILENVAADAKRLHALTLDQVRRLRETIESVRADLGR